MPPAQTEEQRRASFAAAVIPSSALFGTPYTTPGTQPPPAIAADSLTTPAEPLIVPNYTPTKPDYYASIIAGIPKVADISEPKSPEQTSAESTRKTVTSQLLDILGKYSGRQVAQVKAEETAGLPDLEKQLTEVTSQITALQNEAKAIPLQIQQESEGRGRTIAGVAPLEASRLRDNAIKALSLASIASTLQGNVALARQHADRAVEAEFGPLQSELDYLKSVYEINKDAIAGADKEQAARIEAKLKDRQDVIDRNKTEREGVITMVNTALKNGAPASIASQAITLDRQKATELLAPYVAEKQTEWSDPYLLGGDYVQKNLKTGEIRTAVNTSAQSDKTFSTDQTNKGAAHAGLSIDEFGKLDADTKNYFINSFSTFEAQRKLIATGEKTVQEVASDIRSAASIPSSAKQILLNLLGVGTAEASTGEGGGGFWNTVGSILGGAGKAVGSLFGIKF